jgi:hypothetical protein
MDPIFLLLVPALLVFLLLMVSRERVVATPPQTPQGPPKNAILVDGSNVLHWGDRPSALVLNRVLRGLEQKGYSPVVFFDANVGYVLDDHYYNERKLAGLIEIDADNICVVSKGVVADEAILLFATDFNLRIVTNDKYRDWRVQFPHAGKKGTLVGGTWREGSVIWLGKL